MHVIHLQSSLFFSQETRNEDNGLADTDCSFPLYNVLLLVVDSFPLACSRASRPPFFGLDPNILAEYPDALLSMLPRRLVMGVASRPGKSPRIPPTFRPGTSTDPAVRIYIR